MRAGICSIHLQALTPEAATLIKQAVNLATRRGHAQVTPLHVATAMLATSTSLLRKACLQCHSHPLQYTALELCFNVSLNRLPASTPSPLLSPQYSTTPSLSNALVAAFKRAQAHQRRGSIENQQQPILALKIEVEQLIISILDDPSISRVMREAGFSSTLVKSKVEQAVSVEVCSQQQQPSKENTTTKLQVLGGSSNVSTSRSFGPFGVSFIKSMDHVNDDVTSVLSELVRRRRNTVIVGENLANAEGVARGVMERLERGNVQGELRYVQFVSLPLVSFRNIIKEEVQRKVAELRSLVKSYVGRGFILYLGDLKWLFEFWSNHGEQRTNGYCSVEHMVMELKTLISGNGENGRLWLMGIATFRTYMKCKMCQPSLETIWELHPFTVPVGSLSLGLNFDSGFHVQESRSKGMFKDESFEYRGKVHKYLTCCRDCSLNFDKEAKSITDSINISKKDSTTSLPTWLKNCKEEKSHIMDDQENAKLRDICKKWNSFCNSVHGHPTNLEKQSFLVSSSPSSPTVSPHEKKPSLHLSHLNWPVISEPNKESPKECHLYTETTASDDCYEGNLIMFMPERNVPKPDLLSNPNSSPNSASSSEAVEGLDSTQMFKEHNAENLKILHDALEKKVPQQKEIVEEIASTVLLCKSGMRKGENHSVKRDEKQETWMFFLGVDSQAKEMIAKELAKVVFGSYNNFVSIGISSFATPRGDSTHEESKYKRPRDEFGGSYIQRFAEAVNENPHRVFFMEDLEQVDHFSQKGVKQAIESGSITLGCGESVHLKDAIVIFSCESFSSVSRACSPSRTCPSADENIGKENIDNKEEKIPSLSLDLNIAIGVDAQNVHLDGNIGILELADKLINFKTQEL